MSTIDDLLDPERKHAICCGNCGTPYLPVDADGIMRPSCECGSSNLFIRGWTEDGRLVIELTH
jgi:hypothetical protein